MKFIDEAHIEVHAGKGGAKNTLRLVVQTAVMAARAVPFTSLRTATSTRWWTIVSHASFAPKMVSPDVAPIATVPALRM
jgi:hypothetical protein